MGYAKKTSSNHRKGPRLPGDNLALFGHNVGSDRTEDVWASH